MTILILRKLNEHISGPPEFGTFLLCNKVDMDRDGGTGEAARHIPHLILEASVLNNFLTKVAFSRGENSVPHLKKSHSAVPVYNSFNFR